MRDMDIRQALHERFRIVHGDEPDTLILDELGICQGNARIDVAVINGRINGFEIKSEQDTLDRLPAQVAAFSRVFDSVTIVAGSTHLTKIHEVVPDWWGVSSAHENTPGSVAITEVREASDNPDPDPFAIAQLLWRDEALTILEARGLDSGIRSKPRRQLWRRLADCLTLEDLRHAVRCTLKARQGWRSDS